MRQGAVTKEHMSIKEAAAYLEIGYSTVWRMVKKGKIPAAKFGVAVRVKRSDLDALFFLR